LLALNGLRHKSTRCLKIIQSCTPYIRLYIEHGGRGVRRPASLWFEKLIGLAGCRPSWQGDDTPPPATAKDLPIFLAVGGIGRSIPPYQW
jgi:hypothetical protein